MVDLLLDRWYEPADTSALHQSTLIQQILSVIAQRGGARADTLHSALCESGPFTAVDRGMPRSEKGFGSIGPPPGGRRVWSPAAAAPPPSTTNLKPRRKESIAQSELRPGARSPGPAHHARGGRG
jgi:hypothetical protein